MMAVILPGRKVPVRPFRMGLTHVADAHVPPDSTSVATPPPSNHALAARPLSFAPKHKSSNVMHTGFDAASWNAPLVAAVPEAILQRMRQLCFARVEWAGGLPATGIPLRFSILMYLLPGLHKLHCVYHCSNFVLPAGRSVTRT